MLFGCCTTIDHYHEVADAGYGAITLAAKDLAAMDDADFAHARAVIKDGPLKALSLNSFSTPEVRLNGPGYSPEALAAYAAPLLQRAHALGIRYVGIGAPGSRNLPPDVDATAAMAQFEEAMILLCRLGAPLGIGILIEAVCDIECNFITTTPEALALVKRLALPNLHLVYDIYHAHMMNEPLSNIDDAVGEIRVVHIAQDVAQGRRHYLNEAHIEEYRSYMEMLRAAGYQGEVSLEALFGDVAAELPKSLTILKKL